MGWTPSNELIFAMIWLLIGLPIAAAAIARAVKLIAKAVRSR